MANTTASYDLSRLTTDEPHEWAVYIEGPDGDRYRAGSVCHYVHDWQQDEYIAYLTLFADKPEDEREVHPPNGSWRSRRAAARALARRASAELERRREGE